MSTLLTKRAAVVPTNHGISCFVCRQPTELVASCASCPLRRLHAGVGSWKSPCEPSTRGIATNMARPACALPRP
jgi:hypothetical protein